ncbi:hypothetical protein [Sphingomonas sp. RB1R13]|uniref:hypothetical protein n=1 Tax=Sphingomonas sp. RB1R13 TaxID=3096159 RepID=UPI002FCCA9F6
MAQRTDRESRAASRITALLTAILMFTTLMTLDVWNISHNSALRTAIVALACNLVAMLLVRRFYARKGA